MTQSPTGWGEDALTRFLEKARDNTHATFANLPNSYRRFRDLDGLFIQLFADYRDPEHPIGAALALRCHSALRVSAQLAMAGQVPEAFMTLRGALEMAMYAFHASTTKERTLTWLNRYDSEDARKACSREFTPRVMFPVLRLQDAGLGDIVGQLYERTIDYGAHPNAAGVLTTMKHDTTPEGDRIRSSNQCLGRLLVSRTK